TPHVSHPSISFLAIPTSSFAFSLLFLFFNDPATTEIYTLSLHDALPICRRPTATRGPARRCGPARARRRASSPLPAAPAAGPRRSEEHTSELQSLTNLVCRLLLEKKKKRIQRPMHCIQDRSAARGRDNIR